jgi:hypothetical protein
VRVRVPYRPALQKKKYVGRRYVQRVRWPVSMPQEHWMTIYCFISRSVLPVSSKRPPYLIASYKLQGGHLIGSFSREGSLSCHTCCDTGPRFFWSHP